MYCSPLTLLSSFEDPMLEPVAVLQAKGLNRLSQHTKPLSYFSQYNPIFYLPHCKPVKEGGKSGSKGDPRMAKRRQLAAAAPATVSIGLVNRCLDIIEEKNKIIDPSATANVKSILNQMKKGRGVGDAEAIGRLINFIVETPNLQSLLGKAFTQLRAIHDKLSGALN
ncbi:hypothetical protein GEMRC1_007971 [Eukaryota sp. GEM-RC1]